MIQGFKIGSILKIYHQKCLKSSKIWIGHVTIILWPSQWESHLFIHHQCLWSKGLIIWIEIHKNGTVRQPKHLVSLYDTMIQKPVVLGEKSLIIQFEIVIFEGEKGPSSQKSIKERQISIKTTKRTTNLKKNDNFWPSLSPTKRVTPPLPFLRPNVISLTKSVKLTHAC